MYLGIDLGSTNIKAALYDGEMKLVKRKSFPVAYIRDHGFVEFDAEVVKGEKIGTVGATGMATGPNLYFKVCINNEAVDPLMPR